MPEAELRKQKIRKRDHPPVVRQQGIGKFWMDFGGYWLFF
jgi:hypothetical protein